MEAVGTPRLPTSCPSFPEIGGNASLAFLYRALRVNFKGYPSLLAGPHLSGHVLGILPQDEYWRKRGLF